MQELMRVSATARGGREGRVVLDAGGAAFAMALPKEMGGPGDGMNPEQLFAMGWASCYGQAIGALAKGHDLDASRAKVTVTINLSKDDVSFMLGAEIHVALPGADADKLKALADHAHQICPYSRATRNNISVSITTT